MFQEPLNFRGPETPVNKSLFFLFFFFFTWYDETSKQKIVLPIKYQISSRPFCNLHKPYLKLPSHLKATSVFLYCSLTLKSDIRTHNIFPLAPSNGTLSPPPFVPNELYIVSILFFFPVPSHSCSSVNNSPIPSKALDTMASLHLSHSTISQPWFNCLLCAPFLLEVPGLPQIHDSLFITRESFWTSLLAQMVEFACSSGDLDLVP